MIGFNAYDHRPFWDTFRTRHPEWELPALPHRAGRCAVLRATT